MLICYYYCSLLYLECLFCFTYKTHLDLQHGGVHLVTIDTETLATTDRECSDNTAPYLHGQEHTQLHTSIEQPISDPLWRAFIITCSRLLGASSCSVNLLTTPPVKSVNASLVRPPLNASYEPFSLHRPFNVITRHEKANIHSQTRLSFSWRQTTCKCVQAGPKK